ncbi:MAG: 16S rRNA (cytosine(1402)-N(4))-methyltransferase RsmH [Flavobacteriaceae bacterium]
MNYHNAVLLNESIDGLDIKPDGVYVDVTFGGGGHSREILRRLGEHGRLFAFDQDADALKNSIDDDRFVLINENFKYVKRFLRLHRVKKVDGILADLGVSSHQFDVAERGFSTRFEAELDMRMNQSDSKSAFDVVNYYEEKALADVLFEYGELRSSRGIASRIVEARAIDKIKTSSQLKAVIQDYIPKAKEHKVLAQIFQAIRIEVNNEIEVLKEFLLQTVDLLEVGGKLSVISYHSLEDRLVKRLIQKGMFQGEPERDFYGNFSVPFKKDGKLIVPTLNQIKDNNRARSAKLRIAFKL